jgi:hypothetical protein
MFASDSPTHYFGSEAYPWQDNLIPVNRVAGDQDWFVGVAPDAPTDIDFDPDRCAYDAYLASLDD